MRTGGGLYQVEDAVFRWLAGLVLLAACSAPRAETGDLGAPADLAATPGSDAAGGFDPALAARLQAALEGARGNCPAVIAALEWNGARWQGAVGAPADGLFRIGSVSKTFTAVVALQLVAEGKLHLDDPIAAWAPGLPNAQTITLRQALQHTSGVYDFVERPEYGVDPKRAWTADELLALAAKGQPYNAPGAGWHYSNTNFVIATVAIEAATGQTLAHELRARIFEPLALAHTWLGATETVPEPLVPGVDDAGNDQAGVDPTAGFGAGSVISRADDLVRFLLALNGGQLLDAERLAAMRSFVAAEPGLRYGLGLMEIQSPIGAAWGHDGAVAGYVDNAFYFPTQQAALVVACTRFPPPGGDNDVALAILDELAKE